MFCKSFSVKQCFKFLVVNNGVVSIVVVEEQNKEVVRVECYPRMNT